MSQPAHPRALRNTKSRLLVAPEQRFCSFGGVGFGSRPSQYEDKRKSSGEAKTEHKANNTSHSPHWPSAFTIPRLRGSPTSVRSPMILIFIRCQISGCMRVKSHKFRARDSGFWNSHSQLEDETQEEVPSAFLVWYHSGFNVPGSSNDE